jgi:hypothetical protein
LAGGWHRRLFLLCDARSIEVAFVYSI